MVGSAESNSAAMLVEDTPGLDANTEFGMDSVGQK